MNVATAAALASLLIVSPVAAQVASRTPIVLKAAHMFDGRSGSLVDNALLVVQNGRIQAVGGAAPAGMRVIDLGNVTLLPGFIDAHVHLNAEMEKAYDSGFDRSTSAVPVEDAALFAKRTLEAGFTTVRSVGAVDFGDIGLAHSIAAGVAVGPRILTAGHAI